MFSKKIFKFGLLFVATALAYYKHTEQEQQPQPLLVSPKRLKLMTFNVENLFDTLDDPQKNDESFLPLLKKNSKKIKEKCLKQGRKRWIKECLEINWTDFKLKEKMERLSRVILAANPDVLILQEVENLNLLKRFNQNYLGYPVEVLIEGPDKRGIDVAILSRLKLSKKPKLHLQKRIPKPTRGILEAEFQLASNQNLIVLGVHFPSQGSPTEFRKLALQTLQEIRRNKGKNALIVAGGDFNITSQEEQKHNLLENLKADWMVSHFQKSLNAKGTNYYPPKKSWSYFDALLFSKTFQTQSDWALDVESLHVFNKLKVQNTKYMTPARFLMGQSKYGVSDHWPVVGSIHKKN